METYDVLLVLLALAKARSPASGDRVDLGWGWHRGRLRGTCGCTWDYDYKLRVWHVMVNTGAAAPCLWPHLVAVAVANCLGRADPSPSQDLPVPRRFADDLARTCFEELARVVEAAVRRPGDWAPGDGLDAFLPLEWLASRPALCRGVSALRLDLEASRAVLATLRPSASAQRTSQMLRRQEAREGKALA